MKNMENIKLGEKLAAKQILSFIEQVCFDEDFKDFRITNGSNGQRDLIIDFIKDKYLTNT